MIKNIILSILVIYTIFACETNSKSKEIVFVCTHGAARSPIATAYFNKLAKEHNLNYHAVFRGTEPDSSLTQETVNGLAIDGFDTKNWKPEKVTMNDIEKANKVITFDCSVPSASADEMIEWNGTPSISKDYNIARDVIKNHVEQLIEKLKKE
ncbi:hypothetical protein DIS18_05240 [Algibacter marinivivus]|uniref:Phosphotyrosine protein phosphatase I domain-containing protein n=1 Tax=Algibacter marinivivus TaxID=2100723 RepID=A0A2U2X848_9FLAO|nr:hypothetical protein [Algibacter marinivivus]PWH83956.1 hypothetical protein DIS18_05240 [Algibacter marinivivus]